MAKSFIQDTKDVFSEVTRWSSDLAQQSVNRGEYISIDVIPEMSALNLKYLIIGLSGIRMIDEMLMDHLIKIHNVLRLIGIHAILTGIRPALAQVAIGAGLDFTDIETYLNVQQALERLSVAKN